MSSELSRKLIDQVRANRCSKKGCFSQQRDPLDVVWFGQQYGDSKELTCSACYVCNDEAIKASFPTQINVLPVSLFIERLVAELKQYEHNKSSKQFFPKIIRERSKQLLADFQKLQAEITDKLILLSNALIGFCKKIEETNLKIFKHEIFQQIITMYSDDKFEGLLSKIYSLIKMLNIGVNSEVYHFEDVEQREKKVGRLSQQINDITHKTMEVLKDLFESIREKNELISKL